MLIALAIRDCQNAKTHPIDSRQDSDATDDEQHARQSGSRALQCGPFSKTRGFAAPRFAIGCRVSCCGPVLFFSPRLQQLRHTARRSPDMHADPARPPLLPRQYIMCPSRSGPHSTFGTRTSLSAEQEPGLEDGVGGGPDGERTWRIRGSRGKPRTRRDAIGLGSHGNTEAFSVAMTARPEKVTADRTSTMRLATPGTTTKNSEGS